MSFEDRRFEQGRDRVLGKIPGASSAPWVTHPSQSNLLKARVKAKAVLEGTARFDRDEVQMLLAALILSDA